MLVTFSCKAWADITMFGDVAVQMLRMMGHSGTVPGAILAADVPLALERLKEEIGRAVAVPSADRAQGPANDDADDMPVGVDVRAYPLIELLTAAAKEQCDVMWDN